MLNKVQFNEVEHIYTRGKDKALFSVTELLQEEGFINYSFLSAQKQKEVFARGIAVHKATQYFDEDDLDEKSLAGKVKGYLEGWKKFRTDTGWENLFIERPFLSTKLKLAGTPDRIGFFTKGVDTKYLNKDTILDIKTGKPQCAGLQTGGYKILADEEREKNVELRAAIVLSPEGTYKIEFYEDPFDLIVVKSAYYCVLKKRGLR